MRFTTAKETRNPDTHFIGIAVDSFFIVIKEIPEMFQQLFGHNIFIQFLIYIFFIRLADFDNTFNVSVNLFLKHVFNLHSFSSSVSTRAGTPGNSFWNPSFQIILNPVHCIHLDKTSPPAHYPVPGVSCSKYYGWQ